MKLFGRNQDKDYVEEKPIIRYYAKYIGVLGSNKSLPIDEDSYVSITRNYNRRRILADEKQPNLITQASVMRTN